MSYDGWAPYVPAAQRRANAAREIQKLRKKGQKLNPLRFGKEDSPYFLGPGLVQSPGEIQ